jgi:hypothetical protein
MQCYLLLYRSRTTPSSPTTAASGGPNNFGRSTIDTHADQQIDLIATLQCHHLSIAIGRLRQHWSR